MLLTTVGAWSCVVVCTPFGRICTHLSQLATQAPSVGACRHAHACGGLLWTPISSNKHHRLLPVHQVVQFKDEQIARMGGQPAADPLAVAQPAASAQLIDTIWRFYSLVYQIPLETLPNTTDMPTFAVIKTCITVRGRSVVHHCDVCSQHCNQAQRTVSGPAACALPGARGYARAQCCCAGMWQHTWDAVA